LVLVLLRLLLLIRLALSIQRVLCKKSLHGVARVWKVKRLMRGTCEGLSDMFGLGLNNGNVDAVTTLNAKTLRITSVIMSHMLPEFKEPLQFSSSSRSSNSRSSKYGNTQLLSTVQLTCIVFTVSGASTRMNTFPGLAHSI
jgi:hypothetical protein